MMQRQANDVCDGERQEIGRPKMAASSSLLYDLVLRRRGFESARKEQAVIAAELWWMNTEDWEIVKGRVPK